MVAGDCVAPGAGTVYIVVGTGGYGLETQDYNPYPWSRNQNSQYHGYERVVANTTHMHVEFVTTPNGVVKDNIIIPLWEDGVKL